MKNAALFDATQKTPDETPYRTAILFYKKIYFSTVQSCNEMMSKFKNDAIILSPSKKFINNDSFSGV